MLSLNSRFKHAVTRTAWIVVVVVIVVVLALGAYTAVLLTTSHTTNQSTSQSTSQSSTGSSAIPSTFTYETTGTINYLDPQVSYFSYDYNIIQNVYEPLLWFNQANGTALIPWLASSYSSSSNGKTWSINLRQGINFQDGEQFNSTAVYFTLNRVLIDDSSQPNNHNSGPGWILEQALNQSLSSVNSGPHNYTQQWASEVLAQNFVQITGQNSVQLNLMEANAAFAYWLAIASSSIVAPDYVMQHDIALWTSNGYHLPYATLSGNATSIMNQYFNMRYRKDS